MEFAVSHKGCNLRNGKIQITLRGEHVYEIILLVFLFAEYRVVRNRGSLVTDVSGSQRWEAVWAISRATVPCRVQSWLLVAVTT
jgi:hypothetical protein